MIFRLAALILLSTSLWAVPDYQKHFGLRFTTGGVGYSAIAGKSVGAVDRFATELE
jgi:hypothetical protein